MKKMALIPLMVGLVACGTSPNESLYNRIQELEEYQENAKRKRIEIAQEKREDEIKSTPRWYLSPPTTDSYGMFGVGTSKSNNMSHAIKAARLQAEFQLAKQYKQELSGSEQSFEQGSISGEVQTQTTFLIDKLVSSVPVVGYKIIEQKVYAVNGNFQAYTLLQLPYDQFNQVLILEKEKALDSKVKSAFSQLQKRVEKRKQEAEKLKESELEREHQAFKNKADLARTNVEESK